LLLPLGFVPADEAACRGTQHAMMSGIVTGYAADDGPFNATFGHGWRRHRSHRNRKAKCSE
jgi:hypothetical protein